MKKQSMMILSVSALLAIGPYSPKMIWDAEKKQGRFPSSLEEDRLEELELQKEVALKELEVIKSEENRNVVNVDVENIKEDIAPLKELEVITLNEDRNVKEVVVEEVVVCLKDSESSKLEAEIKKLVEDKEAILSEIKELKKAKESKEIKDEETKEKSSNKKEIVKSDNNSDVLSIMSQITSLMVTQQQQQTIMMMQMFSMMLPQMQNQQTVMMIPQPKYSISEHMSPYAYLPESFSHSGYINPYASLDLMGQNVGIGYREPSSFSPKSFGSYGTYQPQFPMNHEGFNFGQTLSPEITRIQF